MSEIIKGSSYYVLKKEGTCKIVKYYTNDNVLLKQYYISSIVTKSDNIKKEDTISEDLVDNLLDVHLKSSIIIDDVYVWRKNGVKYISLIDKNGNTVARKKINDQMKINPSSVISLFCENNNINVSNSANLLRTNSVNSQENYNFLFDKINTINTIHDIDIMSINNARFTGLHDDHNIITNNTTFLKKLHKILTCSCPTSNNRDS